LIITICESLADAYHQEFGCAAKTVFSGANIAAESQPIVNDSHCLSYFGNLKLGRNRSLRDIGLALDEINRIHDETYALNIYTGDRLPEILQAFDSVKSIQVMNFVSNDEVHQLMKESVMLVHTESFEPPDIERVKYSMSTKIADSLSSGVCLFAYGSDRIASIQHLINNNCAAVATDICQLQEVLWTYLSDSAKRFETARQGLIAADKYHSDIKQSELLKTIFNGVISI